MRKQLLMLGASAALLGAALPVATPSGQAQTSAQTQNNAPAPKAMANTGGASMTRRRSALSGDGVRYGFEKPVYRKRPLLTTAQIKRNARKAKNRLRAKGRR